jgi:hypothetical protein
VKYTSEKSNVEFDVLVVTPEEYELYNKIFQKAIRSRSPRISPEFIKPIDRMILTDSLNNIEFLIKTVSENASDKEKEEASHDRIEQEYQDKKTEKYNNDN